LTPYVTAPADAVLSSAGGNGWLPLPSGVLVTRLPLTDAATGLYARLTYRDALEVAKAMGGRLPTREEVYELTAEACEHGVVVKPVTLSYGPEMVTRAHAEKHDAKVRERLTALAWDGVVPVCGVGKHWVAGASPGKARIAGWWDGQKHIQGGFSDIHGDTHHDYATTTLVVRETATKAEEPPPVTTRSTIRLGSTGTDVAAWQVLVNARPDGQFGPKTEAATKAWQQARGLVADGVVGERSWRLAGEQWAPSAKPVGDPRAPACVAALRDANAAWPTRKKQSDGILGDAAHMARAKPGERLKGHNAGEAVDLTHDVWGGCDCKEVAVMALRDPRCLYVIFGGRIFNRDIDAGLPEQWDTTSGRKYTGANGHHHHLHLEVRPECREDASPWPWAPVD
jgi:hypothetical protein